MTRPEAEGDFSWSAYGAHPLPGDASTRKYFRLVPRAGHGPSPRGTARSLILMVFEGAGAAEAGENFPAATRLFQSLGCPVPGIVHAGTSSAGQAGVRFVLEDLGDVTLEQAAAKPPFPRPLYDQALELLIRIQSRSRGMERAYPRIFERRLGAEKIRFELGFLRTHGLESGAALSRAEARALDRAFAAIVEKVAALPRVLNHRDFHSRNIMVRGGAIALVDFQDALMASPFYDLASLLRDSYTAIPAAESNRFFTRYLAAARAASIPVPESDGRAAALFDLVALQRNVKALGTFAYQGLVLGRTGFLASIPKTLKDVRGNPAVEEPEFAPLPDLLESRLGGLA
jgi:aminoglycoside/choline kinase family phosphotransferase